MIVDRFELDTFQNNAIYSVVANPSLDVRSSGRVQNAALYRPARPDLRIRCATVSYTNLAPPFLWLLTMPVGTTHFVWYR